MICECPKPTPRRKPGFEHWCAACGLELGPEWDTTDANLQHFFNRLSDCQHLDETFPHLRAMCEKREREGRGTFGYEYLVKDNLSEALEEASDLVLYPYLDSLKAAREGRAGEDYDLVLTIAYHAAQAFHAIVRLQHKRRGEP